MKYSKKLYGFVSRKVVANYTIIFEIQTKAMIVIIRSLIKI